MLRLPLRILPLVGLLFCLAAPPAVPQEDGPAATPDLREKPLGRRYRFRVRSAGLPGDPDLERPLSIRTLYRVHRDHEVVATGPIGEWVYLESPGTHWVSWNGDHGRLVDLRPPEGWDAARCREAWNRGEAVELVPRDGPVVVPTIWVSHSPDIRGPHDDRYTLSRLWEDDRGWHADRLERDGVTVMYGPEGAAGADRHIAWANTLVHLSPGTYLLDAHGFADRFTLEEGEAKHLRLASVWVRSEDSTFTLREAGGDRGEEHAFDTARMHVVPPGRYLLDGWAMVQLEPGELEVVRARERPRARLGARVRPVAAGLEIVELPEDGAAAAAGLERGDVLLRFGGETVESVRDLADLLAGREPGDEVEAVVRRPGAEEVTVRVRLR